MGSDFQYGCDQFGCKNWKNLSRKVPPFKFPTSTTISSTTEPSDIPETTTTMQNVITSIRNFFTNVPSFSENTSVSISSMPTEATDTINTTFTDIIKLEPPVTLMINENSASINNVISSMTEITSASSVTNAVQNTTLLPEIVQNGKNLVEEMGRNSTGLSTVQNAVTEVITTQEAITFFNSGNISATTLKSIDTNDNHFMDHLYNDDHAHYWLYVILSIITAILVLIGIILLLIYIRYRKFSSHYFHNYYDISPMKEVSNNSDQQEQKTCDKDVFVQYAC